MGFVSTTKIGSGIDSYSAINPILARAIQSEIEYGYQRFIELVSEGRKLSLEEVDSIAQGRVWVGETALKIGLVDNLGNLADAIKRAAELAGIEDFKTFYPSKPTNFADKVISQLVSTFSSSFLTGIESKPLFNKSLKFSNQFEELNDPKGIYAKCLDCLLY